MDKPTGYLFSGGGEVGGDACYTRSNEFSEACMDLPNRVGGISLYRFVRGLTVYYL